eukprot:7112427-Ditylum_brightwellii.AAC.1
MDKTYQYKIFKPLGKGGKKPKNNVMICVHLVYTVKQDGKHINRLVAGDHITGPTTNTYYSSVILLRAMGMMSFLDELNDMELITADNGSAYLEAYTVEK